MPIVKIIPVIGRTNRRGNTPKDDQDNHSPDCEDNAHCEDNSLIVARHQHCDVCGDRAEDALMSEFIVFIVFLLFMGLRLLFSTLNMN